MGNWTVPKLQGAGILPRSGQAGDWVLLAIRDAESSWGKRREVRQWMKMHIGRTLPDHMPVSGRLLAGNEPGSPWSLGLLDGSIPKAEARLAALADAVSACTRLPRGWAEELRIELVESGKYCLHVHEDVRRGRRWRKTFRARDDQEAVARLPLARRLPPRPLIWRLSDESGEVVANGAVGSPRRRPNPGAGRGRLF